MSELILKQRISPGETLLFLDEIQVCPKAITALRYFKEKLPSLHVIGAGSLLDILRNPPLAHSKIHIINPCDQIKTQSKSLASISVSVT